jgi:hypothetical protein
MHSSNSSKSGSDIDEADDIEVDWDDGPGFDSISPDNINIYSFDGIVQLSEILSWQSIYTFR